MIIILVISLSVVLALAIVAVVAIINSNKKDYTSKDKISFIGGVNSDTGKFSKNADYFKGIGNYSTTVVGYSKNFSSNNNQNPQFVLTVSNISQQQMNKVIINNYLIFGRNPGENGFVILNDPSISKQHFKVLVDNGYVYICDLNSSNHTYVNGQKINSSPLYLKSGSKIKAGNTYLIIEY